jgi:hypothetical protein
MSKKKATKLLSGAIDIPDATCVNNCSESDGLGAQAAVSLIGIALRLVSAYHKSEAPSSLSEG